MNWNTTKKYYKTYEPHDRRLIKRFAWFPIHIYNSNKTVWLQYYYVIQHLWYYDSRNAWGNLVARYLKWQGDELYFTLSEIKNKLKKENNKLKEDKKNAKLFMEGKIKKYNGNLGSLFDAGFGKKDD